MKFATVLSLGLVGTAFAFPSTPVKREASLVQRDYPTISSAIADIQSKTSALDTQVKNYQTTANSAAVQSASDNVLASINNGNSKIAAGTSVTLAEAYQIGNQVDGLTKVYQLTIHRRWENCG
ncbi:hypothetical protein EJ05DRAFT_476534 [Pseudovirgaria hyperparasitica]|uniref:Uncharacterized protein n=1 Tax=Pseudovirgaria hyperparasitica TaxID=470096 RepID=A0A6A6W7U6_9PEZI|nr:uncharacterized protein EJ05DRAFT_476534 [Pseudovirgaria hyperparasitica]KAF2758279.1 hypothetical protein EJ05DRAFT_476534 [Pseudovirgaria hyperparasitica]